ncbi:MAG: hypothetical protein R6U31_03840 [bacterium]
MINIGADKAYIKINITDYEFPEMGPDDYDSNWLEFTLDIESEALLESPPKTGFLRAEELMQLKDYLRRCMNGELKEDKFEFLDGTMDIKCIKNGCNYKISIDLFGELTPGDIIDSSFGFTVDAGSGDIKKTMSQLTKAYKKFPCKMEANKSFKPMKKFIID